MKYFKLQKYRRLLKQALEQFKRKQVSASSIQVETFKQIAFALDQAILERNVAEAKVWSQKLEYFMKSSLKKSPWDHFKELFSSLLFAVAVAVVIWQAWFQLYKVPTGSMRPTIEEEDRLFVSKTTFGIHLPFRDELLFHSPSLIQRAGGIVFTVGDLDVPDANMRYFYIVPGKKSYVKRCMGKPGDTLYFYGGQIYGIDKEGKPITELFDEDFLKEHRLEKIDHIPFITFEGRTKLSSPLPQGGYASATFSQMYQPVAKLELSRGKWEGKFFNGSEWVPDQPAALKTSHTTPSSYSDLWGIRNYAMVRLLSQQEVSRFYKEQPEEKAAFYLELRHTPNLTYPQPDMRRGEWGKFQPSLTPFTTLLPVNDQLMQNIKNAMITSRFYVQNGRSFRYHEGRGRPQRMEFDPLFPGVPDGCYEFYYGKGYKVLVGGIMKELPADHPLNSSSPEVIQKLFNLGIHFNMLFQPMSVYQPFLPQRFAYFRHGDLYVMGAPVLDKNDSTLKTFIEKEKEKQNSSSSERPYIAFVDQGAPLKANGEIDSDFIKAFGFKIPDNSVLALGDNYAMSADSRDFGPVPVNYLRGSPSFTFWPPSKRIGPFPQPSYSWFTIPNVLVWGLVILIAVLYFTYQYKRSQRTQVGWLMEEKKDKKK